MSNESRMIMKRVVTIRACSRELGPPLLSYASVPPCVRTPLPLSPSFPLPLYEEVTLCLLFPVGFAYHLWCHAGQGFRASCGAWRWRWRRVAFKDGAGVARPWPIGSPPLSVVRVRGLVLGVVNNHLPFFFHVCTSVFVTQSDAGLRAFDDASGAQKNKQKTTTQPATSMITLPHTALSGCNRPDFPSCMIASRTCNGLLSGARQVNGLERHLVKK